MKHGFKLWPLGHVAPIFRLFFRGRQIFIGPFTAGQELFSRAFVASTNRNRVGVLIDKGLKNSVVGVRRQGDRIILVKLVIGDMVLNVISAYAPK